MTLSTVANREIFDHAQTQQQQQQQQQSPLGACMDNGSNSNASSGSNFFYDNFQEMQSCETSPGYSASPTNTQGVTVVQHFPCVADDSAR
jgi:hypothetical protein